MKKLTPVSELNAARADDDRRLPRRTSPLTFPIGDWGNSEKVDEMLCRFQRRAPRHRVTVEYLDYTNGDAQITTAIEAKTTPDIVMEGPERPGGELGLPAKCFRSTICGRTDHRRHQRQQRFRRGDLPGADGSYYMYPLCDGALHGHQQDRV
ncbi:MAG: hypothetical protein ACLS6G_11360 [Christensenellales bacterium]